MIGRGSARHGMKRCVTSMRRNGAVHSVNGCKILDDLSDGVTNAFSMLMHDETRRHFSKTPMLVVPAIDPD